MKKSMLIFAVLYINQVLICGYVTKNSEKLCPDTVTVKEMKLKQLLRELWADHGIWTHEYIIAALADMPNIKEVTQRLLSNQDDIGKALVPFYGAKAGNQLAQLLKDHILIAADLVSAAKSQNQDKIKQADEKWHKNARDIAQFLSKANPHWPEKALVNMLNQHLKLTTEQAIARLNKQWSKDIKLYDQIRSQLGHMADDLASGIIQQFPNKF